MTLRIGDEKITYRLAKAMKHSLHFDNIGYCLDVIDELVDEYMQEFIHLDPCEEWHDVEEEVMSTQVVLVPKEESPPGMLKKIF